MRCGFYRFFFWLYVIMRTEWNANSSRFTALDCAVCVSVCARCAFALRIFSVFLMVSTLDAVKIGLIKENWRKESDWSIFAEIPNGKIRKAQTNDRMWPSRCNLTYYRKMCHPLPAPTPLHFQFQKKRKKKKITSPNECGKKGHSHITCECDKWYGTQSHPMCCCIPSRQASNVPFNGVWNALQIATDESSSPVSSSSSSPSVTFFGTQIHAIFKSQTNSIWITRWCASTSPVLLATTPL